MFFHVLEDMEKQPTMFGYLFGALTICIPPKTYKIVEVTFM